MVAFTGVVTEEEQKCSGTVVEIRFLHECGGY